MTRRDFLSHFASSTGLANIVATRSAGGIRPEAPKEMHYNNEPAERGFVWRVFKASKKGGKA